MRVALMTLVTKAKKNICAKSDKPKGVGCGVTDLYMYTKYMYKFIQNICTNSYRFIPFLPVNVLG